MANRNNAIRIGPSGIPWIRREVEVLAPATIQGALGHNSDREFALERGFYTRERQTIGVGVSPAGRYNLDRRIDWLARWRFDSVIGGPPHMHRACQVDRDEPSVRGIKRLEMAIVLIIGTAVLNNDSRRLGNDGDE